MCLRNNLHQELLDECGNNFSKFNCVGDRNLFRLLTASLPALNVSINRPRTSCCSYLAIVAALASEADYVFIPEDPAETDWPEHLCKKLLQVQNSKSLMING